MDGVRGPGNPTQRAPRMPEANTDVVAPRRLQERRIVNLHPTDGLRVPAAEHFFISVGNTVRTSAATDRAKRIRKVHKREYFTREHGVEQHFVRSLRGGGIERIGSLYKFNGNTEGVNFYAVKFTKDTKTHDVEVFVKDLSKMVSKEVEKFRRENPGVPYKLYLVGHSMGGLISLGAAEKLEARFGQEVKVVTVYSPIQGTGLLRSTIYDPRSAIHRNFHPRSPFVRERFAKESCVRLVARYDHAVPLTPAEQQRLVDEGAVLTDDGHSTFSASRETHRLIRDYILQDDARGGAPAAAAADAAEAPARQRAPHKLVVGVHGLGSSRAEFSVMAEQFQRT